jgi:putative DNA primase/helicase
MTMQGGYAKAARPETIARGRRNSAGPSEDLARLAGARVVNISELPQGLQMDSALVKTLTGGDTVTARFLNEGSFEFRPQFKIFINTNYKMRVDDPIVFSSGRMKLISFNRHFSEEEQDKDLKEKLSRPQELSGILNWCLRGLEDYLSNGIREPQCVKDDTEAYRQDSDTVCQFIDATMDIDSDGEILTTKAYAAYTLWCGSVGVMSRDYQSFRETVEAQFTIRKKRPKGSPRTVAPQSFICGVRWREGVVIGAAGTVTGGD